MYTEYYDLSERPFEAPSDPKYLWIGEKHREILSKSESWLHDEKGFAVLVGEEGTGKTALVQALMDRLEGTLAARIAEPVPDTLEFLNRIAEGFNPGREFDGEEEFLIYFKKFLRQAHRNDKKVLLIVDQAQTLTEEILERLRLLSNIELPGKKLIHIFLVGRNTLYEKLKSPSCRGLAERIELHLRLPALSKKQCSEYIRHRVKAAGGSPGIFTEEALRRIEKISSGNPGLINKLCDLALSKGHAKALRAITPEIIRECRREILPWSPLHFLGCIRSFSAGLLAKIRRRNADIAARKRLRVRRRVFRSAPIRWSLACGMLVLLIALLLPAIGDMPGFNRIRSIEPLSPPAAREKRIFRLPVEDEQKGIERPEPLESKAAQDPAHGYYGDQNQTAAAPEVSPPAFPAVAAHEPAPLRASATDTGFPKFQAKPIETEVLPYFHTVQQRGETLSLIAEWYTGSAYNWKDIAEANPGIDPHRIHIGDEIFIPQYLLKIHTRMPADYLSSQPKASAFR
jgi:type II secretory pathway predicted ATPase ExeA